MLSQVVRFGVMVRVRYGLEGLAGEEKPVLNSAGLLRVMKWAKEAKGIETRGRGT
jgi:hypothetical protein